jgi:hypothetical protein
MTDHLDMVLARDSATILQQADVGFGLEGLQYGDTALLLSGFDHVQSHMPPPHFAGLYLACSEKGQQNTEIHQPSSL